MIVIRVELWPCGYETRKKILGTMRIVNDGTGTDKRGNYYADVLRAKSSVKRPKSSLRHATINDWPRKSRPVWDLVLECLHNCGYKHR